MLQTEDQSLYAEPIPKAEETRPISDSPPLSQSPVKVVIIGQDRLKQVLAQRVHAARAKGWRMPNMLFCGPEDIGKKTFAISVAERLSASYVIVHGGDLQKRLDLSGTVLNLEVGSYLIVDRVDLASPEAIHLLSECLNSYTVDLLIGTGPGARTMRIPVQQFTFIGTSLAAGTVPTPLRDRLTVDYLSEYSEQEFNKIVALLAGGNGLALDVEGMEILARYGEGKPGRAIMLLSRLAEYTQQSFVCAEDVSSAFDLMGITRTQTHSSLIARLRSMTGIEFEQWTASLFQQQGFQVSTTPASGDHGIDLVISRGSDQAAVQCKRW